MEQLQQLFQYFRRYVPLSPAEEEVLAERFEFVRPGFLVDPWLGFAEIVAEFFIDGGELIEAGCLQNQNPQLKVNLSRNQNLNMKLDSSLIQSWNSTMTFSL